MPTPSPHALIAEHGSKSVVVYDPLPHQQKLHEMTCRYGLLEGGRGSGKSLALRMDPIMRCLAIPRFSALIVRRSIPELKSSHFVKLPYEISQLGLAPDAWHSTDFILRFPNRATLRFGHLEDEAALTKLLSSEYDWIGGDELATLTYRQFSFLCTSLRTTIPGIMPVFRGGTNPVGVGAGWVKAFFIDKNPNPDEFPDYDPSEYESVHADLDDNPYINPAEYAKLFSNLPSKSLREALRHGTWSVEGQFFSEWAETCDEKPWHAIERMPTLHGRPMHEVPGVEIVRALDWGYSASAGANPGVCLWFACLPDGTAIGFQEYYFQETLPVDVAARITELSAGMKVRYTVADTQMFAEHEGPSIAEHFNRAGVPLIESDKERIAGWVEVHNWLRQTVHNGLVERPKLSFWREGCPHTIRTMAQMVVDPKNPLDMQTKGVEDDAPDCVRYFLMSRPSASRLAQPDPQLAWMFRLMRKAGARGRLGSEALRR